VAIPSRRLERRVRSDFGAEASEVLTALLDIPESLPLAEKQDPERLHAALVLPAEGRTSEFANRLHLAQADWRDALVSAGLGDQDWPQRLEAELGPPLQ
jgi:hypothetical protein